MMFVNDTEKVAGERRDMRGIFILRMSLPLEQTMARDKPADTGDCELSVMAARTYLRALVRGAYIG